MIPSARFGEITINEIKENKVTVSLYSLYYDGIESVANNKPFCLWIITEAFEHLSFHSNINWEYRNMTREFAKEKYEQLKSPQKEKVISLNKNLSKQWVSYSSKEAFLDFYLKTTNSHWCQREYSARKENDMKIIDRLTNYAYDEKMIQRNEKRIVVDYNYFPVKISLTQEGVAFFKLQNEKEKVATESVMDQRRFGDFMGAEDIMDEIGNIIIDKNEYNETENPDYYLKTYLLFPLNKTQFDLVSKYYDKTKKIDIEIPENETEFIKQAEIEIQEVNVNDIYKFDEDDGYQEQGMLTFKVSNKSIIQHLCPDLPLSF